MTAPARKTLDDQIASLERELVTRRAIYVRWTEGGTMAPEAAENELACAVATLALLRTAKRHEESFRAWYASRLEVERAAASSGALAGVKAAFPGSEVVGYRKTGDAA